MLKDTFTPIEVGRVIDAYGVKGWIKIKTDTQRFDSLAQINTCYLLLNNKWIAFLIENYTYVGNIFRAKINGIDDRDAALALKGTLVAISRSDLPELDNDEYYWTDLINCQVINSNGDDFGKVKTLMETGSSCVLVTKLSDKEYLIPFVAKYIIDVKLKEQLIIVDWELDY